MLLTRTAIENATTAELEELKARIEQELTGRVEHDLLEDMKKSGKRSYSDLVGILKDPHHDDGLEGARGTYQWEMRECGHKNRCQRCKSGRRHGPYLYRYYYRDGKQHSEYVPLGKARELGFERPAA